MVINWYLAIAGIAIVIIGYVLLTFKKKEPKKEQKDTDILKKIKTGSAVMGALGLIFLLVAYSRQPALLSLITVLGAIFVGGLVLPIAILLGNKKRVCLILRMVTGKNWGLIRLMNGQIEEKEKIKSMDKDYLEIDDNIYIIQSGRIYLDGNPDDLGTPIKDSHIKMSSGIPILYLDRKSITPLTFFKDENSMSPQMVSSVLKANAIDREAELLTIRKSQGIKITLLLVGVVVAGWFSFQAYNAIGGQVIPTIKAVCTPVATAIKTQGANIINQ